MAALRQAAAGLRAAGLGPAAEILGSQAAERVAALEAERPLVDRFKAADDAVRRCNKEVAAARAVAERAAATTGQLLSAAGVLSVAVCLLTLAGLWRACLRGWIGAVAMVLQSIPSALFAISIVLAEGRPVLVIALAALSRPLWVLAAGLGGQVCLQGWLWCGGRSGHLRQHRHLSLVEPSADRHLGHPGSEPPRRHRRSCQQRGVGDSVVVEHTGPWGA